MEFPQLPVHLEPSLHLLDTLGLLRTRHGYYEAKNKPSREELEAYYRDIYHQDREGSGPVQYQPEEIPFMRGQVEARHRFLLDRGWFTAGAHRLLDVGCGEGHALSYFLEQGWNVHGLDFSNDACSRMNPHCVPMLTQGNVLENLDALAAQGELFEVINLDNVLEHVLDPPGLLKSLHRLLTPNGVLIIEVPNDFSQIQMTALTEGRIERAFWVSLPQHLSYFTAPSLNAVCVDNGWECVAMLGDFPVDWFLTNPYSNYMAPSPRREDFGITCGKAAHLTRVTLENMMRNTSVTGLNNLYESMASLGVGRCVTGFFRHTVSTEQA